MEKKKIIQLVIVIGAFLGMGLVLYNGMFKSSLSASPPPVLTAAVAPASILPYGSTFDFQIIDSMEKQGFVYGQVQYPVVSTSTEVGKTNPSDLIQPIVQPNGP